MPGQVPPPSGAGSVQVLSRVWKPTLQDMEHWLHSPQFDQLPETARKMHFKIPVLYEFVTFCTQIYNVLHNVYKYIIYIHYIIYTFLFIYLFTLLLFF